MTHQQFPLFTYRDLPSLLGPIADIGRLVGRNGGAAGTLLIRRANTNDSNSPPTHVVLHQRNSGHWALPGGVIDLGETPREAAFRESFEEASLPRKCREGDDPLVIVTDEVVTYDHETWRYTVFICNVTREWAPKKRIGDYETLAVEWVPVEQVTGYKLHSDFKAQWPALLRAAQATKATKPVRMSSCSLSPGGGQKPTSTAKDTKRDKNNDTRIRKSSKETRKTASLASFSSTDLLERRYQSDLRVRKNISNIKALARREGFRT